MGKVIQAIYPICGTCHGKSYGKTPLEEKPYIRLGKVKFQKDYSTSKGNIGIPKNLNNNLLLTRY